MKIIRFTVSGYRSIREAILSMGPVNLIVGANGSGKTNLYRSLFLLHAAADGRLAQAVGDEGGMASVIWAGRRRKGPVRVELAIELESLGYEIAFGLPQPDDHSAFKFNPLVKTESAWLLHDRRRVCILERTNATATVRDAEGKRILFPHALSPGESVLSELREPGRFPELATLREEFLGWRFYHQFRTDEGSPLRRPQLGVRTPVLAHDGRDLVPALQTILEIGDRDAMLACIERAFPGSVLRMYADSQQFSLFGIAAIANWQKGEPDDAPLVGMNFFLGMIAPGFMALVMAGLATSALWRWFFWVREHRVLAATSNGLLLSRVGWWRLHQRWWPAEKIAAIELRPVWGSVRVINSVAYLLVHSRDGRWRRFYLDTPDRMLPAQVAQRISDMLRCPLRLP